jgi:hypothetical protein
LVGEARSVKYMSLGKAAAGALAALMLLTGAARDVYFNVAEGDAREKVTALWGEPSELTEAESQSIQSALKGVDDDKGEKEIAVWKRQPGLFYVVGYGSKGTVVVKHRVFMLH